MLSRSRALDLPTEIVLGDVATEGTGVAGSRRTTPSCGPRTRQRDLRAERQPAARLSPRLIGTNRRSSSSDSAVFCKARKEPPARRPADCWSRHLAVTCTSQTTLAFPIIEVVFVKGPEPDRRNELRAADSDRDAVVERLRDAAAEGRLEHTELDARVEQALTAKTYADLAALTADLPPEPSADPGEPLLLKGGLHGAARSGRWRVPARITVYGGMGGARLDFTRTATRLAEVEVEAHGQWAGVTIVIPDGWGSETGGLDPGIGGLRDKTTPERLPGTPLLRLTGTGGTAGVTIRHPNSWERRKLRRNQPSELRDHNLRLED